MTFFIYLTKLSNRVKIFVDKKYALGYWQNINHLIIYTYIKIKQTNMNRKLKLKIRHNIKLLIALSKVALYIITIATWIWLLAGLTNRILNAFLWR